MAALLLSAAFVGRWVFASTLLLLSAFVTLITFANWWHFSFFQAFFNFQSLAMAGDSPESLLALPAFPFFREFLIYLVFVSAMAAMAIGFYRVEVYRSPGGGVVLLVIGVLAFQTYERVDVSLDRYRQLNMLQLLPSYLHPAQAFFEATYSEVALGDTEREAYRFFVEKNRIVDTQQVAGGRPLNVLTVVLESVRADMLGYYGSRYGLTPNLDAFATENIAARYFYANSNYTMKGETAIWCGIFDHNARPPISKYSSDISDLNCLPQVLRNNGYRTLYFHGNSGQFYSRRDFLPLVGFDSLNFYADEHEVSDSDKVGWGVADTIVYDQVLKKLGDLPSDQPFYASVMTLSSHYPFSWNWEGGGSKSPHSGGFSADELYENYKDAIRYEDRAFGEFLAKFKASKLARNTILVVTADHGVWVFPDEPEEATLREERFFRIPFFMYHPDVSTHRQIDMISSQIDIAPTLLKLLGISSPEAGLVGKDILGSPVVQPWAVMMKSGGFYVRTEDGLCYTMQSGCSGVHQNCIASIDGEVVSESLVDSQYCVSYSGDPLRGGRIAPRVERINWLGSAVALVNYDNKKVFGGEQRSALVKPSNDPGLANWGALTVTPVPTEE